MALNILMPALSPTMEEGTLAKWLVAEGDSVASGQIIAEIETDKATMEFEAVDEGVIGKILIAAGTEGVKVNTPIAVLLEEGASPDATVQGAPQAAAAPEAQGADAAAKAAPAGGSAGAAAPAAPRAGGSRILASPLAPGSPRKKGLICHRSMAAARTAASSRPMSKAQAPPHQTPPRPQHRHRQQHQRNPRHPLAPRPMPSRAFTPTAPIPRSRWTACAARSLRV